MRDIYYIKSVDNSRWAPAPNPREPHYTLFLILVGAALLGSGLYFARERYQSRQFGYQVEGLGRQVAQLQESNRKLRLEQASLEDPLRIDSIARTELGMTTLAPQQIYRDAPVSATVAVVAERRPVENPFPAGL